MKINVTTSNIKRGQRGSAIWCPIAIACRRAGLSTPMVALDILDIVAYYRGHKIWASLPPKAFQAARDFDNGKTMKPFSFVIRLRKQP